MLTTPTANGQFDFARLRAPEQPEDRELSAAAFKWMASLPRAVRPIELGRRYPRIANRFALIWPYQRATDAYLKDLLIDQRGNRQGFSPAIAVELAKLRAYFDAEVAPTHCIWEKAGCY